MLLSDINYLETFELKMNRTALWMGVLIYAPIGYLYSDVLFDFKNDGFVERLPYTFSCLFGIFLSYIYPVFNKIIRFYVVFCALLITGHFQSMIEANNNHWLFITGSVQVPLIMTTVFYHKIDAIVYFIISIILGEIFLKNTPFYTTDYPSFFYPALIGTYLVVYYFFLSYRKDLVENLHLTNTDLFKKNKQIEKLNLAATQAAHDIRSPVQALSVLAEKLSGSPENKKIVQDSISRIQYIAESLLSEYRQINSSLTSELSDLVSLCKKIVSEKKNSLSVCKCQYC